MTLDFTALAVGKMNYKLYFICDSYLGADQEFDLKFRVEGISVIDFLLRVFLEILTINRILLLLLKLSLMHFLEAGRSRKRARDEE